MALRKILTQGDEQLLKRSRKVEKFDARLHTLIDDMRETLENSGGVGLAAPQDDFACMRELEGASETKAPAALAALENADERFGDVIAVGDMSSYVETKCGELL